MQGTGDGGGSWVRKAGAVKVETSWGHWGSELVRTSSRSCSELCLAAGWVGHLCAFTLVSATEVFVLDLWC